MIFSLRDQNKPFLNTTPGRDVRGKRLLTRELWVTDTILTDFEISVPELYVLNIYALDMAIRKLHRLGT